MNTPPVFCATVLYPYADDHNFDFDLYKNELLPAYAAALGDNCIRYEARKGLTTPGGQPPAYICIANVWISSPEQFGRAMGSDEMKAIMGRIGSFTAIAPLRQFEQVL